MSLEKNELSAYATSNYIWSLAVLSNDEINTGSYIGSVPKYTILRSGGFTKDSTIITAGEAQIGANVEYFIDEVDISSLYSPNPKTGVTAAVNITFKVMEPYSVGLFFQTLSLAALQAGHQGNYIKAPMLLRCQFIGFDDLGNKIDMIVRDLAISLVDANFSVNAGGAIYSITAIPWNHQAYSNEIQQIKTEDKLSGYTVEEILGNGSRSLASYLNKAELEQVKSNAKQYPNEYIIEFPDGFGVYTPTPASYGPGTARPGSLPAAPKSYGPGTSTPGRLPAAPKSYGPGTSTPGSLPAAVQTSNTTFGNTPIGSIATPNQKIVASTSGSVSSIPRTGINTIGTSEINTDFNFMGNQEYGFDSLAYDSANDTYSNGYLTIGPERMFSFRQGTEIYNIIEQVILTSTFTRDVIARLEAGGTQPLTWFRVETQVFNMKNEGQKQFIYKIMTYQVDRSLFVKQGTTNSYDGILSGVKKGYNYIYTGTNTDITNFDITINAAFFQTVLSDSAANANNNVPARTAANSSDYMTPASVSQAPNSVPSASANTVTGGNVQQNTTTNPNGGYSATVSSSGSTVSGGSDMTDARQRVARHFHDVILNSNVELISIDLEIWGDPYFLPDTHIGNHETTRGMNYQQAEVDIILNFNTPIDFDSSNTILTFSSLDQFVGLYKIVQVRHSFTGGMFKQTLTMVRRPGQSKETLDAARAMLVSSQFNIPVDGLLSYFSGGTDSPVELIYTTLFNSLGLSPLLTQVASFKNISNILPLPKDLLSAFSTISTFSSNIAGIAASVQSLASVNLKSALQGTATNLFKNAQSNLQNTISSFTQPITNITNSLKNLKF